MVRDAEGGFGNGGKARPGWPCPVAWLAAIDELLAWLAECADDESMFTGMLDSLLICFSEPGCGPLGRSLPVLPLKGANLSKANELLSPKGITGRERDELPSDGFPAMGCVMPDTGAEGRACAPVCEMVVPELALIVCLPGVWPARVTVLLNKVQDGGCAGGGGRLNRMGRPVCCP